MGITFLFARFDDRTALDRILDAVEENRTVLNWAATEGSYQLALSIEDSADEAKVIMNTVSPPDETIVCPVKKAADNSLTIDPESKYSFLLIDARPDQETSLLEALKSEGTVVQVNQTDGPYNLIAMAKADLFDEIDRLVDSRIAILDGVLRVRQLRVLKSWAR